MASRSGVRSSSPVTLARFPDFETNDLVDGECGRDLMQVGEAEPAGNLLVGRHDARIEHVAVDVDVGGSAGDSAGEFVGDVGAG